MTIAELLERVEGATGPDRELDAALCATLRFGGDERCVRYPKTWTRVGQIRDWVPVYSASLDAALALVERVLPGWTWEGGRDPAKASWAYLYAKIDGPTFSASAPTAALALLAALLRSLPPALDGDE